MNQYAIRVENLSKLYRIGATQKRYDTLRDMLVGTAHGWLHRSRHTDESLLWALKDISFDVRPGEVLGVIGHNGAGKSTLLKILSRITDPTSGRIVMNGRVGSLLEVGTGFHPELTGRENIYLNGAILGMRRVEIGRKFDEIVAFAEIEKFLDTPVKRYSSGMYVRLAFAVAAHLEPEILLVDEVLAVGDVAFQDKCLGKMSEVSHRGRTVLFVSHNMPAVRHLCNHGIVLMNGCIAFSGTAADAVGFYLQDASVSLSPVLGNLRFVNSTPNLSLSCEPVIVEVLNESRSIKNSLCTGEYAIFRIGWRSDSYLEMGGVELGIHTPDGIKVIQYSTRPLSTINIPFHPGINWIECEFPVFPLAAGQYSISIGLTKPGYKWLYKNDRYGLLTVEEADVFHSGTPVRSDRALIAIDHRWVVPEGMSQEEYQS